MKGNEICRKKYCTGCEACASACPHQAISMKEDWRGFRYPSIDTKKCTDCGLCQKICPMGLDIPSFKYEIAYAFVEKNKEYLYQASSGGAFGVMARYVIGNGGIVFGASMDDEYHIEYKSAESVEDLKCLYGSKYVQSYVGDAYIRVKDNLRKGRWVLFCGCPCQVAGLKSYLRKDYANLFTMDLICHGVPSQPYFHDYVTDLLKRKMHINKFRFRWKPENPEETKDKVYVGYSESDYYMSYFLWGKGLRPGCYRCHFAGGRRQGDFTVGDFWQNEKTRLPIDDAHGASLVFFNTEKARSLRDVFEANGACLPLHSLSDAVGGDGGQLKHPSTYDIRCDLIYILYKLFGIRGPKMLFGLDTLRFKVKK